jgi:hypothetical protein
MFGFFPVIKLTIDDTSSKVFEFLTRKVRGAGVYFTLTSCTKEIIYAKHLSYLGVAHIPMAITL